ncbi:hypothetical protein RF11_03036 [Thelohanellus kitauei]|uniref:Peptidase A2 domain-containing protein n=1 Tax=Thelohanellus kitauei TaxID=669202 RepID=A0A0C2MNL8_THEKT|nr:hypothetical protein RF11_03036 [Thelohanellus kitauei]
MNELIREIQTLRYNALKFKSSRMFEGTTILTSRSRKSILDLNKTVSCLIDTGASVSLIRSEYVDPRLMEKANAGIVGVDGSSLNNICEADLRICLGYLTTMWRLIVVKKLVFEAIIGRDIMFCYVAQINFARVSP